MYSSIEGQDNNEIFLLRMQRELCLSINHSNYVVMKSSQPKPKLKPKPKPKPKPKKKGRVQFDNLHTSSLY